MADDLGHLPSNAPAWLANWIGRSDERFKNIETAQAGMVENQTHMNEKLDLVLARLPAPSNPTAGMRANGVTHKWLSEKLWLPLLLAAVTFLLGLLAANLI